MRIVICEDELIYQKCILEKIDIWKQKSRLTGIQIVQFTSSEDLLYQWDKNFKMDMLFLDIQFSSEMDGMELARRIRERDARLPIVFITNSGAYVHEGYKVRAMRYLEKPIQYEDIEPCLEIAYKHFSLSRCEYFTISEPGGRLAILFDEILYFEAQSPYTIIHKYEGAVKTRFRFADIFGKLHAGLFASCHRSYIVNLAHVRGIKRKELLLSDQTILPISKPSFEPLSKAFDSYYQGGAMFDGLDCL